MKSPNQTIVALIFLLIFGHLAGIPAALGVSPVRTMLSQNRLEEAAGVCRQFESLTTSDPDNFFACAWVYYRTSRLGSGDRMVEKGKALTNPGPQVRLLEAYRLIKQKKFERSKVILDDLSRANRIGAFGTEVQLVRGEWYEAQGNLDTAAFIYKQIIADTPREGRAHWGLGRYYLGKGEFNRARKHLSTTASLWPKHLGSRYNMAVLHLERDEFGKAASWLAKAYRLDRSDSGVLEQIGVLFEKKKKIGKAIKYWERALTLNKDAVLAKEKLGKYSKLVVDALMRNQQWGQALTRLEKYPPAVYKAQPELLFKRGMVHRNLGNHKKAVADLQAYTAKNKRNPEAFRELGIAYVNMNLPEKAGQNFVAALDLEPNNGMNYAWVAFILEGRGQLAEARQAWEKAVALMKDPVELKKANRRLASVKRRMKKKHSHEHDDEDEDDKVDRQFRNWPE